MTNYEINIAGGDMESRAIRNGIEWATSHDGGPFEFGHYIERYDGPLDGGRMPKFTAEEHWTPLIYEAQSREDAEEHHRRHYLDTGMSEPYRHSRIVRRAVSPWEVYS